VRGIEVHHVVAGAVHVLQLLLVEALRLAVLPRSEKLQEHLRHHSAKNCGETLDYVR
jgi:hypothetical protein